jgi:DNA-binding PadR family transcriptional regulator
MTKPVKRKNAAETPSVKSLLTIPDLVVLSLLAEKPMHGYEVNSTLEERKIREWAPVSRPQIYYSLEKLVKLSLIRIAKDDSPAAGPERRVFETTAKGRDKLAEALETSQWVEDRVYQPFLIWLALSWQARGGTFRKQLENRKKVLRSRLADARATLASVLLEVGHSFHEAVWMLELFIEQAELELKWLDRLLTNADRRAPARYPAHSE